MYCIDYSCYKKLKKNCVLYKLLLQCGHCPSDSHSHPSDIFNSMARASRPNAPGGFVQRPTDRFVSCSTHTCLPCTWVLFLLHHLPFCILPLGSWLYFFDSVACGDNDDWGLLLGGFSSYGYGTFFTPSVACLTSVYWGGGGGGSDKELQ